MPIVVMTTAPHDVAALIGAVECLGKPFDLDQLLACVARYLRPTPAELTASVNPRLQKELVYYTQQIERWRDNLRCLDS